MVSGHNSFLKVFEFKITYSFTFMDTQKAWSAHVRFFVKKAAHRFYKLVLYFEDVFFLLKKKLIDGH